MSSQGAGCLVGIEGLEAFGRHGVTDAEQELGQRFVIDLEIDLDQAPGTISDRLEDTVDYDAIADAVVEVVGGPSVRLLERLAQLIADRILEDTLASGATITVRKPHVALFHTVAATRVTIHRRRHRTG